MPADLSSANWKIDRAVELLRELDSEVAAWHGTKPYSYYTYVNPEKTRASVIVREHVAPEKIRWSLYVADIIHNLRCALDHAFWAVLQSEFESGIPTNVERLSFPVWDSPPIANQRRNYRPVGDKIFAALESVQPYNCPDERFPVHPLAIIRDIDNANKHKLLFTVMPSIARIQIAVSGLRGNRQYSDEQLYRGELKEGVEALVTTFFQPQPYVEYKCTEFSSILAVKHPIANRLGQDRDDYASLVDVLIEEVRSTIATLVRAVS